MEISKITWRAALSGAAFGKSSAVYGHIDENGASVRNWPARKMAITDKMGENRRFGPGFMDKCSKNSLLSVNHQHNGQKFTDKSPENAGLSVKCVLLTDKPSKMCSLSVNLNEILAESVE